MSAFLLLWHSKYSAVKNTLLQTAFFSAILLLLPVINSEWAKPPTFSTVIAKWHWHWLWCWTFDYHCFLSLEAFVL